MDDVFALEMNKRSRIIRSTRHRALLFDQSLRHPTMFWSAFAIIVLHASTLTSALSIKPTPGPIVATTSGRVQGYLDTNTTSTQLHKWYGVRFAQDTSGNNRWKPPQPYFGTGIFNATAFGPACLQGRANGGNGTSVQSEDCLTVNIIAPVGAKNLPVYVYSLYVFHPFSRR